MAIFDIWMEWFEQFRLSILPLYLLKRIYALEEDIVWSSEDAAMVAQHNDSAS